jgi:hypothetical protein
MPAPLARAFTNADCAVIPYILRLELLKLGATPTQADLASVRRLCCLI